MSDPPADEREWASQADGEWMVDLEHSIVKAFNWSLRDIDETDLESLVPFITRLPGKKQAAGAVDLPQGRPGQKYADQVSWL